MVSIPGFPSTEVLEAMGRAVVLFAQLEYCLIVVYKRALPGTSLPEFIEQRGEDSLGGLLNGVTNRGDARNFEGLLKIADQNHLLRTVKPQLEQASELTQVRKKYVHGGIARRKSDSKWLFLKSGEETSEPQIINELERASTDIGNLIGEIQKKIPTPYRS
jgi:hypothetical protein